MRRWVAMAAARRAQGMLVLRGAKDFQADASDLAEWRLKLAGRQNVSFVTLANLNHLLVDVPEGPSTGVEYYREGWVSPAAIEAVEGGLSRCPLGSALCAGFPRA